MLVLAHAGHWLPYVVPAVIVLVTVIVSSVRERRERMAADRREPGEEGARTDRP